ncbi:MAG: hypothetical protein QOE01_1002 [Actinomycetota bacterium]|nr:hypothetical protein [Actinomycetota bacterium]
MAHLCYSGRPWRVEPSGRHCRVGKWEVVAVRRTSKIIALLAATLVALAFGVGLADARAGKFLSSTAGGLTTTTTASSALTAATPADNAAPGVFLTVKFNEVGVGANRTVDYALQFAGTKPSTPGLLANLICVNNGNNQPQGVPLTVAFSGASETLSQSADAKGNVDGSVTYNLVKVAADNAKANFKCGSGQTVEATYVQVNADLLILDKTNGSNAVVSGAFPLIYGAP